MKAILVIDLPEDHLIKATNDLYDLLHAYDCELKPLPLRKMHEDVIYVNGKPYMKMNVFNEFERGWNACLEEIEK